MHQFLGRTSQPMADEQPPLPPLPPLPEQPAPPAERDPRLVAVGLAVAVEGGMILLAWGLGWLLNKPALATFSWGWREAAWGVIATLPMLVVFFGCLLAPAAPFRRLDQLFDELLRPFLGPCTLLDLAGISLLAGLGEEMLFRGVLQAAFTGWTGNVWVGLALASLLFGLVHALTLTYAILATLLGAYLGYLWQQTDNLLAPIIAHALYDFIALVIILRFQKPNEPEA
jgi:membrane protease YdiL (CAAX protease family)